MDVGFYFTCKIHMWKLGITILIKKIHIWKKNLWRYNYLNEDWKNKISMFVFNMEN